MKKKRQCHYCRVCGEYKANEKFSGKGHAAYICKACASKSPAERSEDITINKLHGMAFRYLSESEMNWLKNRRSDARPEVRELAQEIFEQRFPRQARNEIKARLHIKNIVFHVHGDVYDEYGDEYTVNAEFAADTSGKIVRKLFDENGGIEEQTADIGIKAARKFFNVMVHNYDISFWGEDLCYDDSFDPDFDDDYDLDILDDLDDDDLADDGEAEQPDAEIAAEPDDRVPTWIADIKYKNGTEQNFKGYDSIPDPVNELYNDFNGYFEEDLPDEDFDYDEDE